MTQFPLPDSTLLWPLVKQTTREALASGALQPIDTHICTVDDGGIPFLVRIIDSLARKEKAQQSHRPQSQNTNPFLPYEEALFVADLSPSHLCLLNKFNVVEHHLLMVTRAYVSQQAWLIEDDFIALARCVQEIDGLGFYNSGPIAGASQHHKHLQLVPFPEPQGTDRLPLEVAIRQNQAAIATSQTLPVLPFQHRIQLLSLAWTERSPQQLGADLHQTYRHLMQATGIALDTIQPEEPYNLLMTRQWMMVVRRSQPDYQNISVNSLGYAGWLLVKTADELNQLRQLGPMTLLTHVGLTKGDNR